MDVLTKKSYKDYSYTSRYSAFPFYYNSQDNKYIYGIGKQLGLNTAYVSHELSDYDTLDSLALKYYGRPDYYWILADYNRIQDPFIKLIDKYDSIKIPTISNIYWK